MYHCNDFHLKIVSVLHDEGSGAFTLFLVGQMREEFENLNLNSAKLHRAHGAE